MENFERKLVLNKQTFSALSERQMDEIQGGTGQFCIAIAGWAGTHVLEFFINSGGACLAEFGGWLTQFTNGCGPYSQETNCTHNNICAPVA